MKLLLAILFLIGACSVRAQTTVTPFQALHPIMKDPNKRNAPSSLDQDSGDIADMRRTSPNRPSVPTAAQPAKPVEIVARIDVSLAASAISLIGTVNGIKGKIYVTNIGSLMITPLAQFAVCDQKGFQIGMLAKTGTPLAPEDTERIDVLATNLNAVDLKLMKLVGSGKK
jgi:hypothetical protein